jgi:hypothetical protein
MKLLVGSIALVFLALGLAPSPAQATDFTAPYFDRDGHFPDDPVVTVVEPGTGNLMWYWRLSGGGHHVDVFGNTFLNDIEVPADYDGDFITDPAVWRPGSPGVFHILGSTSGYFSVPFGDASFSDVPTVVGDYDGDGAADIAIYRPGRPSVWYVRFSSGGYLTQPWGEASDFPTPADYDGDGLIDIAVQRPTGASSPATFHIDGTSFGYRAITFGIGTDLVVPGEFNDNGEADICVVRQEPNGTYTWHFLFDPFGSRGYFALQWGSAPLGDYLTAADYTGDGRTDVAIWRPGSPSHFFIRSSTDGAMVTVPWGEMDHFPVVANYVK